jgi:hypothetical protein
MSPKYHFYAMGNDRGFAAANNGRESDSAGQDTLCDRRRLAGSGLLAI